MKEAKRLFGMSSSIALLWVMIILPTVQSSVYGADPKSAWQAEWDRTVGIGRMAAPEDIADLIAFLSSERARHITGAVLNIDGGGWGGV